MDCTELVGVRQQDTKSKGRVKMGRNKQQGVGNILSSERQQERTECVNPSLCFSISYKTTAGKQCCLCYLQPYWILAVVTPRYLFSLPQIFDTLPNAAEPTSKKGGKGAMGYFKGLSLMLWQPKSRIYHLPEKYFNVKNCKNVCNSGHLDFLKTFYGIKGKHLAVASEARQSNKHYLHFQYFCFQNQRNLFSCFLLPEIFQVIFQHCYSHLLVMK